MNFIKIPISDSYESHEETYFALINTRLVSQFIDICSMSIAKGGSIYTDEKFNGLSPNEKLDINKKDNPEDIKRISSMLKYKTLIIFKDEKYLFTTLSIDEIENLI